MCCSRDAGEGYKKEIAMSVYIIAEAGVNHNGNVETAMHMIETAKRCGCDCIKFQIFRTEELVTREAKRADYQIANMQSAGTQYDMLKKLELQRKDFERLKQHCDEIGIDFMATPFDRESVDILEQIGVKQYKISSGDVTDKGLLQYIAAKRKPMILSTGMCTMEEVEAALQWIKAAGNTQITLLHCTSNYPTPYAEVNMNAMQTLGRTFGYETGYSDHTEGILIPVMAAAMGAVLIEKHFTLDKNMEGPDHKASLAPDELKEMVDAVRNIELAKGDGIKRPAKGELSTREAARKSIVMKTGRQKGDVLSVEDMTVKRPGTGIAPQFMEQLAGKRLRRSLEAESAITWEDVE